MVGRMAPYVVLVSILLLSRFLLSGMGTTLIQEDPPQAFAVTAQARSYLPVVWGAIPGPTATPRTPLPTSAPSPSGTPSPLVTATATSTPTATTAPTATATRATGTPTNTPTPENPTATKTDTPEPSHTPTATPSPAPTLNPPEGVNASDGVYADRVQVIWRAVPAAATYEVYRSTAPADTGFILGSSSGPSFSDSTAVQGVLYYYRVRACNLYGCSDFSAPDAGFLAATP